MQAWRISNYSELSGIGGKYYAGRWNHLGTPIVYCAEHPALAMLEILVHLDADDLPENYRLLEIDIPETITVTNATLPNDWQDNMELTRTIFQDFVSADAGPVMRVPSAIMPACFNLLLNPEHADHTKIQIAGSMVHPLDSRFKQ